ncbi:hypothetical protein Sango_1551500 [Sesamum angolense]|uniref:Uncharacterized protein n=1 Tax=Sesamum angolense TaxID=2727404 RepID=A0AAE1WPI4_9LAMI|nr:hypothetical protein Sango_1551500 [Sesamum angolense]
MNSWRESECQATENPGSNLRTDFGQDEAVLDTSSTPSAQQLSDVPHTGYNDRPTGKCILLTEDDKLMNDSISSNTTLLLKESCSSFHDRGYIEKIEEFQFYVDTVKKIAKPGCSPEMLEVALNSVSSLVKTLSMMSSGQYMHASL